MKRYLLVGIALLFVNANASLKEDFERMDQEEEQLLSDMRNSAALTDDDEEDEEEIVEIETSTTTVKKEEAEASDDEERTETIRKQVMVETKEKDTEKKSSSQKLEVIKQGMTSIDEAFEKSKVAREKEAISQIQAEKREVEAYEKQRAEKLAQEEAEKAEAQKVKEAKIAALAKEIEIEKKKLAEKALKKKETTQKPVIDTATVAKVEKHDPSSVEEGSIGDINVSRELLEKTKVADSEYEKAVKEMQQED